MQWFTLYQRVEYARLHRCTQQRNQFKTRDYRSLDIETVRSIVAIVAVDCIICARLGLLTWGSYQRAAADVSTASRERSASTASMHVRDAPTYVHAKSISVATHQA